MWHCFAKTGNASSPTFAAHRWMHTLRDMITTCNFWKGARYAGRRHWWFPGRSCNNLRATKQSVCVVLQGNSAARPSVFYIVSGAGSNIHRGALDKVMPVGVAQSFHLLTCSCFQTCLQMQMLFQHVSIWRTSCSVCVCCASEQDVHQTSVCVCCVLGPLPHTKGGWHLDARGPRIHCSEHKRRVHDNRLLGCASQLQITECKQARLQQIHPLVTFMPAELPWLAVVAPASPSMCRLVCI